MEPIGTMLQQTGQHVARQRSVLLGRTRTATHTFATETKGVGKDLAQFVRSEARRWQRYVQKRADHVAETALGTLAPRSIERRLLTHVDVTLRALDARVRVRLHSLSGARRTSTTSPATSTAAAKSSRRSGKPARKARKTSRANGSVTLAG